jgi:hypothetical protein
MIPVLHDGWPLSYHPNSPSALHLLTLLEACPRTVEPVVLLPTSPPEWIPTGVTSRLQPTPNTNVARLGWEQRILPAIAHRLGVKLIHLTSLTPALSASVPTVLSPAGFEIPETWGGGFARIDGHTSTAYAGQPSGFVHRLRQSLAIGALDQAAAILWPEDLPCPTNQRKPYRALIMPPTVHPAFLTQQFRPVNGELNDLPATYFLYHGPHSPRAIRNLLLTWSWASGPIGELSPLVIVGLQEIDRQQISYRLSEYDLEKTVHLLPALPPQELAWLYQGCNGLIHPAPVSVWEGPVRQALASCRPVVALKTGLAEALVGPAAYLVDERDTRAMGAALITISTEESIAISLSQAARERSLRWDSTHFQEKLTTTYQNLAGNE